MPITSSKHAQPPRDLRHPRVPLYVPVFTEPELGEAWCINISLGGMALFVPAAAAELRQGELIGLEVALPDVGHVRASARVQWVDARREAAAAKGGPLTCGVAFVQMGAEDRAILSRFLLEYRPHAVVLGANAEEYALATDALEPDVPLHRADRVEELRQLIARGDIHVILAFGEAALIRSVEAASAASAASSRSSPLAPPPRVVFCGKAAAEELLRLHNEGAIHQTVPSPPSQQWLRIAVRRGCEDYALRSELRRMNVELSRAYLRDRSRTPPARAEVSGVLREMVLESRAIRGSLELVRAVAPHDAHVLLQGETGTGKELFARALHELSGRAAAPFVAIDCGALPETLLESELFGHVEGAFTGATRQKAGLFEIAESGTLFLDEIENTTPSLQSKLLRAIETGEVRAVGGSAHRRVDVRVVAASNRDLRSEVARGAFRSDLYYRLNAFPIDLPPLRDRREDIIPLARAFLRRSSEKLNRPLGPLTAEAEALLRAYAWPGNVRELRNAVERAALLTGPHQPVDVRVLPPALLEASPVEGAEGGALQARVDSLERQLISEALLRHGGVARRAAKELGVSAVTLGRKMKRFGLGAQKR